MKNTEEYKEVSKDSTVKALKDLDMPWEENDTTIAINLPFNFKVEAYRGCGHGYIVIKNGKLDTMRYTYDITNDGKAEQNIECTEFSKAIILKSGSIRIEGDFSCGQFIFYKKQECIVNTYSYDYCLIIEKIYIDGKPTEYYAITKNGEYLDERVGAFKTQHKAKKYAFNYVQGLKKEKEQK